jgi:hypothetical protein
MLQLVVMGIGVFYVFKLLTLAGASAKLGLPPDQLITWRALRQRQYGWGIAAGWGSFVVGLVVASATTGNRVYYSQSSALQAQIPTIVITAIVLVGGIVLSARAGRKATAIQSGGSAAHPRPGAIPGWNSGPQAPAWPAAGIVATVSCPRCGMVMPGAWVRFCPNCGQTMAVPAPDLAAAPAADEATPPVAVVPVPLSPAPQAALPAQPWAPQASGAKFARPSWASRRIVAAAAGIGVVVIVVAAVLLVGVVGNSPVSALATQNPSPTLSTGGSASPAAAMTRAAAPTMLTRVTLPATASMMAVVASWGTTITIWTPAANPISDLSGLTSDQVGFWNNSRLGMGTYKAADDLFHAYGQPKDGYYGCPHAAAAFSECTALRIYFADDTVKSIPGGIPVEFVAGGSGASPVAGSTTPGGAAATSDPGSTPAPGLTKTAAPIANPTATPMGSITYSPSDIECGAAYTVTITLPSWVGGGDLLTWLNDGSNSYNDSAMFSFTKHGDGSWDLVDSVAAGTWTCGESSDYNMSESSPGGHTMKIVDEAAEADAAQGSYTLHNSARIGYSPSTITCGGAYTVTIVLPAWLDGGDQIDWRYGSSVVQFESVGTQFSRQGDGTWILVDLQADGSWGCDTSSTDYSLMETAPGGHTLSIDTDTWELASGSYTITGP